MDLRMLPLIQKLISKKWETFAGRLFIKRFYWALATAVAFSFMVVFPLPIVDPRGQSLNFFPLRFWPLLVCRCFVWYATLTKTFVEAREMITEGPTEHFNFNGAPFLENTMSMGFCCTFMLSQLLGSDTALAFAALFFWSYLLWFMLGFNSTGHLVVMVYRIVLDDMLRFFSVTSIFLMGFSLSTFTMTTATADRGWDSFMEHVFDFLHGAVSGFDKDQ